MTRRLVFTALFAMLVFGWSSSVLAEERPLTGAEVDAWISGNTVVGVWAGTDYKQYFSPQGWTDYDPAGAPVDRGRWWVTQDRYCSNWDVGGDSCYRVSRDGDTLVWVTGGLLSKRFTAEVVPGNQLDE